MSFTPLTPPKPKGWAPAVRMSAQENKRGQVNITLSLPADILAFVGKPEDQFTIELGGGQDAGVLRIVKAATGLFKPRLLKNTAVFRLGEPSFAPDAKQKKTELRWEQAGRALRIRLPSWCLTSDEPAEVAAE